MCTLAAPSSEHNVSYYIPAFYDRVIHLYRLGLACHLPESRLFVDRNGRNMTSTLQISDWLVVRRFNYPK